MKSRGISEHPPVTSRTEAGSPVEYSPTGRSSPIPRNSPRAQALKQGSDGFAVRYCLKCFCFLCFTSSVSFTGSYTEVKPNYLLKIWREALYIFGKFTVVFLLRYWAVKHLQNIGRISCGCHFGVYTCDDTCSIENNSGALLYIISAEISSIENIFRGTSASLDREVTRFVLIYVVWVILHSHTCIMRTFWRRILSWFFYPETRRAWEPSFDGKNRCSLSSGFPRNKASMGAEFREKNSQ